MDLNCGRISLNTVKGCPVANLYYKASQRRNEIDVSLRFDNKLKYCARIGNIKLIAAVQTTSYHHTSLSCDTVNLLLACHNVNKNKINFCSFCPHWELHAILLHSGT